MASNLTERSASTPPEPRREDVLLACLVWLTHHHDRPASPDTLRAGLPLVDDRLTPDLFVRACARAGLTAKLVRRRLDALSKLVLPAVLLLKDRQACILAHVNDDGTAEVLLPETGFGSSRQPLAELAERYIGYAILTRPVFRFDERAGAGVDQDIVTGKHWFRDAILKSWRIWLQVAVAALLINLFSLVTPLFAMNVYDRVVPNLVMETLWVLAIGAGLVLVFDFLVRMLRGYFIDFAGKSTDVLLASSIFQRILGMRFEHRPPSAGAFANEMREYETLREFFTSATLVTLIDLPFVLMFVAVIAFVGGPLAWVPIIAIPVIIGIGFLVQIPLDTIVRRAFREAAQRHAILIETLNGIETIKSLGAEGRLQRRWEQFVAMAAKSGMAGRLFSSLALSLSSLVQGLVSIAIIVWGVYEIADGQMTMGALIACSMLSGRTMAPLSQVAGLLTRYSQSMTALRALDRIMHMPQERSTDRPLLHRPHLAGAIEFNDVSFEYPNGGGKALDGVSFKIAPGERVAMVGRVGSGKSTASKLLLGLYHATSGSVTIDGTDIRQIDPADLRRHMGVVPQEVFLFNGTIKENIVLGAPDATDSHILAASRLVGLDDYVQTLPKGYDMMVGERGERLSGGQRQLITLARALVRNPSILLLDEPTSAMDQGTEERIKARLAQSVRGKTVILITHRPSLLSIIDRLIVLDQGRIVADGPRDQVLKSLMQAQNKMRAVQNQSSGASA